MSKKHLTIKLDCGLRLPWAAPPDKGRVLGTVRQGQQFGYLVLSPDGQYVQVNGAIVRPLSVFRVRLAMRNASHMQETLERSMQPAKPTPAPVVIVKKKRRVVERPLLQGQL
jgi:hypothetical protein